MQDAEKRTKLYEEKTNTQVTNSSLHLFFISVSALGRPQSIDLLNDRGSTSGRVREGIRFFVTMSRPAVGPTQSPIQRVPGIPNLG